MQSMETACEEGEASSFVSCHCDQKNNAVNLKMNMVCTHSRSFKKAKTTQTSLPLQPIQDSVPTDIPPPKPQFCIHTKLLELHLEECANDPNSQKTGLKRNSHLLEKLVARERLNTLILNLYPGNKGYSLTFPTMPNTDVCADMDTADMKETKMWPYEDEELLRYIDNEELPAFFVDLLEPHYTFLFYSGCIIAQVRDYRQAYPACKCDIHHVLLKPTLQSIFADINAIADEKVDWGTDEKQQLESQILLANNPTLCLDPKSTISVTTSRINHNRQLLNTYRLRRAARKYSQVTVNRKKKLVPHTHRPGLELYDFLTRTRGRLKPPVVHSKSAKKPHEEIKPVPVPNLDPPPISAPRHGVHITEFKAYPKQEDTSDCLPQLVEEYVLETDMHSKEKDKRRVYHIKLSILQRPSNGEYLGELYLDRDHKKGERNGVACRFPLGTRVHANRYIQQFTEIFTEGGRKSVTINYGLNPGLKERVAQVHAAQIQNQHTPQVNLAQQHLAQLNQSLQNQCVPPMVNGTVNSGINMIQRSHVPLQTKPVPILQAQLQSNAQVKTPSQQATSQEIEINALATKLMNSAQQFQAAANAKQQQQQKLASSSNNAAIINLLNSSPASNVNSDASAAVVNAINNSTLLPQQVQTINQKLLGRKITLSNVQNARVLNHNLIAVNNNRMSLSELSSHLGQQAQPGQTITLTTVNSGNFTHANYTTVPIKQPINQRIISDGGKSALSALLVGTPAADRPDIIGPNTNSLLLEKLAGASGASPNPAQSPPHFIQSPKSQYTQSPKNNPVMSPLSSPPPQNTNTINVQSLNFTPLQSLSGLQNVQVQLPGFSQPISLSLNVSSTGTITGHPTSLLVSVPVTSGTATSTTAGQQTSTSVSVGTSISVAAPTVVLANTGSNNIAQLVTSGVKGITQQSIRAAGSTGVTLTQGGQPFQLITPVQRPRMQQAGVLPQNITARGLQRTPITIKMATPQANVSQVTNLQKQAQIQQYQQLCLNQQQKNIANVRRRSNVAETQ